MNNSYGFPFNSRNAKSQTIYQTMSIDWWLSLHYKLWMSCCMWNYLSWSYFTIISSMYNTENIPNKLTYHGLMQMVLSGNESIWICISHCYFGIMILWILLLHFSWCVFSMCATTGFFLFLLLVCCFIWAENITNSSAKKKKICHDLQKGRLRNHFFCIARNNGRFYAAAISTDA